MSFVRKEDAAKAGKLIGAIVAVFGCAAWRVVGAVAKPASTTALAMTEAAPIAAPASSGATPPPKAPDAEIELPTLLASANVNPFRPFPAPPIAPPGRPTPPPSSIAGALTPLPPTTGEPSTPSRPMEVAGPEKPAVASFRVSGILAGPHATAVLDLGEESTVVHAGSLLSDGSTVVQIDGTSVTLGRAGKKIVLTLAE